MELAEAPMKRAVTKVYSRKRGRKHRDQLRTSTSNGGHLSGPAGKQFPEEQFSKNGPSTPPRKQPSPSRASSTSVLSSPKKVSLSRDLYKIFSPNGKASQAKQALGAQSDDDSNDDHDMGSLYSGPYSSQSSPRPPKSSFADRMLPRKHDENRSIFPSSNNSMDKNVQSKIEACPEPDFSSSMVTNGVGVSSPAVKESTCLTTVPQKRTYGRTAGQHPTLKYASLSCSVLGESEEPPPSIQELKDRWAELDDLDGSDEDVSMNFTSR
jgi:hypothetical protein